MTQLGLDGRQLCTAPEWRRNPAHRMLHALREALLAVPARAAIARHEGILPRPPGPRVAGALHSRVPPRLVQRVRNQRLRQVQLPAVPPPLFQILTICVHCRAGDVPHVRELAVEQPDEYVQLPPSSAHRDPPIGRVAIVAIHCAHVVVVHDDSGVCGPRDCRRGAGHACAPQRGRARSIRGSRGAPAEANGGRAR